MRAKYCLATLLGISVLVLVGCGHNGTNQSTGTNSTSASLPSTNDLIRNNPVAVISNVPVIPNGAGTNLSPATNPPVAQ